MFDISDPHDTEIEPGGMRIPGEVAVLEEWHPEKENWWARLKAKVRKWWRRNG